MLVSRQEWGAKEGHSARDLMWPLNAVRVVFNTNSLECHSRQHCCYAMRTMQEKHQKDRQLGDINFNFMIGGDGNIYEARGFSKKVTRLPWQASPKITNWLTIGYLGDYKDKLIPDLMISACREFIKTAVNDGKLAPEVMMGPNRIKLAFAE